MLKSGNGRHRRPRQAPTAVVALAATGAGITLPLLGAGGAQAADASTWDKVALCESGGMWSANPGNGFYGGLGITKATWEMYGGTDYAERPDLASRSQQIAVAEKILGELGPDAWPGCDSGLSKGGSSPAVDPGATEPPTAPAAPDSPDPVSPDPASPDPQDQGPSDQTPSGKATPKSAAPGTGAASGAKGSTPGTPGTPAATPAPGQAAAPAPAQGNGRHAKPRTPAPSGTAPGDAAGATLGNLPVTNPGDATGRVSRGEDRADAVTGTYTVVPGDSLCGIAATHHLRGGWTGLYDANKTVVGGDPDFIYPGQRLTLGS